MNAIVRSILKVSAVLMFAVATFAQAATVQVDFTLAGPPGATAAGFITYDDVVVAADSNVVGPDGLCAGSGTDNSIDYQITFSGGAADGVVFNKSDCTGVAFCDAPDFDTDVNFFGCSAGGFSGSGVSPNTFQVNGVNYTFDGISAPAPVDMSARPIPALPVWALLSLGALLGFFGLRTLRR